MATTFIGIDLLKNSSGAATSATHSWPGGQGLFCAVGTFSTTSVSLQFMGPDSATWLAVSTATTLSTAGSGLFNLPPCQIRVTVTGAGSAGIYATAGKVGLDN